MKIEVNETAQATERRKVEYPELAEQLDALFHDIEAGTLDKDGEFFKTLQAVKTKFPKEA